MARVTKCWWVEGVKVDPTPLPNGEMVYAKVSSRPYHVISAAQEYADALRKSGVCVPNSVVVRTRQGNDKIDNPTWPLSI